MFGDFLHNNKHRQFDPDDCYYLENGTPVVARRSYCDYQFGIYGKGHVIYQDCWTTGNGILVFGIDKSTSDDFFEDAEAYVYRPDFDFDKTDTFRRAVNRYSEMKDSAFPASEGLRSVYGDDFTLLCMLGSEELFCHCFENSKMGRHYTYPFLIAGLAPAHHHLLAIEEGYAIHFSDGDGYGSNDIICESMDHISHRAGFPLTEVHYNHVEVPYRLLARNRALLIFSGKWRHGSYNLLFNNCEHFVTLCKAGRSESNQARSFFSDAFMIGLSLFTRRPQFISMVLARRLGKFFE